MKTLAEIFYDAIQADTELMEAIGSRVVSTCFEVPPDELDNTPLPNIIITNDGFQNNTSTKDCVWESDEDAVQASVDVAASSPQEVDSLVAKVKNIQKMSKKVNKAETPQVPAYVTELKEKGAVVLMGRSKGELDEQLAAIPSDVQYYAGQVSYYVDKGLYRFQVNLKE